MEQREEQFMQLVELHAADVIRFIASLIPQREDAEDVAQDVFLALYQGFERYDAKQSSLKTWMFRIAYHKVLHHHRYRNRMQFIRLSEDEIPNISEDASLDISDETVDAFLHEPTTDREAFLVDALSHLPEDDRLLILLYYREDKSIRDISYITDRSEPYLASRLQFLRKKLCKTIMKLEQHANRL